MWRGITVRTVVTNGGINDGHVGVHRLAEAGSELGESCPCAPRECDLGFVDLWWYGS